MCKRMRTLRTEKERINLLLLFLLVKLSASPCWWGQTELLYLSSLILVLRHLTSSLNKNEKQQKEHKHVVSRVSFLYKRGRSQILSHGFLSYRSPAASKSETDLSFRARVNTSEELWSNCSFTPLDHSVLWSKVNIMIRKCGSKIISMQTLVCNYTLRCH